MNRQAKTLIERHGFLDTDRRTPMHDEIQLWAYANLKEIIPVKEGYQIEILKKGLDHPISFLTNNDSNRVVVGFVDLRAEGYLNEVISDGTRRVKYLRLAIEIKSRIDSCGDLIRQINFYRKYTDESTTWFVISPDDRYRRILWEHGIYFLKYPKKPERLTLFEG